MTTPHGYPMTTPHGYPMSRGVMSLPSHSLSYEAREMACHALEAYAERLGGKGRWLGRSCDIIRCLGRSCDIER